MRTKGSMRSMLAGAVTGAAAAYFLDPDRGVARRARASDQLGAMMRRTTRKAERAGRRAGAEAYGVAQKVTHLRDAEQHPDDGMIKDKIMSEVLGDPRFPKGSINVNVVDGVAVLRGQVRTPDDIAALERAVRGVTGVREVESLLHLPETPAPNKEEARRASAG